MPYTIYNHYADKLPESGVRIASGADDAEGKAIIAKMAEQASMEHRLIEVQETWLVAEPYFYGQRKEPVVTTMVPLKEWAFAIDFVDRAGTFAPVNIGYFWATSTADAEAQRILYCRSRNLPEDAITVRALQVLPDVFEQEQMPERLV